MNLDYMESNFMCWVTTDHPPSYASNRIHDVICANCASEKQQCLGGGGFLSFRGLLVALSDDGQVVLTVNMHVTSLVCWKLRSRN